MNIDPYSVGMTSNLAEALPPHLRGPDTAITPIQAGLSGAGVYRVTHADHAFALKVSALEESLEIWMSRVQTQQRAAEAGLAPRVVHIDKAFRAVLSEFVTGNSFMPFFRSPTSRHDAIVRLGDMVRRVHQLPIPAGHTFREPRVYVANLWQVVSAQASLPAFARTLVEQLIADEPPPPDPPVLSHNDLNPSNLAFDGTRLWLLDWDVASANEPCYDIATLSFFLRMDESTTRALLEACDQRRYATVPSRIRYDRRIVGTLSGVASLGAALRNGHPGATGDETLESTPVVDEVYRRFQDGSLRLATAGGQWIFGLAMIKSGQSF